MDTIKNAFKDASHIDNDAKVIALTCAPVDEMKAAVQEYKEGLSFSEAALVTDVQVKDESLLLVLDRYSNPADFLDGLRSANKGLECTLKEGSEVNGLSGALYAAPQEQPELGAPV